jgi:transcriptional regulator with XRE-family HTH domain
MRVAVAVITQMLCNPGEPAGTSFARALLDLGAMARKRKKKPSKTETLGDRIRRFRIAKGLTQAELAARSGVAQQTITYYEVRGVSPPPALLIGIADALDVSTDILLGSKKTHERGGGVAPASSVRRQKHLRRLDELPLHDQKAVFKIIDALAERRTKMRGG